MNYYKISITATANKQDIFIALLSVYGYDGFEQEDFSIKTYMPEEQYNDTALAQLAEQLDFSYKTKLIPNQNWNALWESNFQPISINNFCAVRADFHPAIQNVKHEIIINPKMAFGTGHHETTYLMMQLMATIPFEKKQVLDFGCGTGILSILAAKEGARDILAIDIDPLSIENTHENITRNDLPFIVTQLGDINSLSNRQFDIILANINRNVIISALPNLHKATKANGQVLFSGILLADADALLSKIQATGFSILDTKDRGEWICIKAQKNTHHQ